MSLWARGLFVAYATRKGIILRGVLQCSRLTIAHSEHTMGVTDVMQLVRHEQNAAVSVHMQREHFHSVRCSDCGWHAMCLALYNTALTLCRF